MRMFEMVDDNGGYDPQHDKMTPAPEKKPGFWTRPHSPRELKVLIACSVGLAATVVLYAWAVYPNF